MLKAEHKVKLRFHLGAGENFGKWQLTFEQDKKKLYIDPERQSIILKDCKLVNQKSTAKKIHEGAHKTVCAWIEGTLVDISLLSTFDTRNKDRLDVASFNPKKNVNWTNKNGNNIDGLFIEKIQTLERKVYF